MWSPSIGGIALIVCGIYGVVSFDGPLDMEHSVIDSVAQTLEHRGPDGANRHVCHNAAIGIQLLRIIEPRSDWNQPFCDSETGAVLVCNGEIYNANDLRRRYTGYGFKTASDIEPLLPLYLDKGPESIPEAKGMFALAVWDPNRSRLLLARDRAGEKPLFYATVGSHCVFGSEIQAVLAHPDVSRRCNNDAVRDVLTLGYPLGTKTPFQDVQQVEPGTIIEFLPAGTGIKHRVRRYWHPLAPEPVFEAVAADELDVLLEAAVRSQLVADVPVGIFTSGGVDSALLAAYATKHVRPGDLHTFSVGFDQASFDERGPAKKVAQHFGTQHVDIIATKSAMAEELSSIVCRVAEPITDPAVIPTALLAAEAKRRVGVVLSGEGADELFGGYPTYLGHAMADRYNGLPGAIKHLLSGIINRLPTSDLKVPVRILLRRFVAHADSLPLERHLAWFGSQVLPAQVTTEMRNQWNSAPGDPGQLTQVMHFDYHTYLRALLAKIDRATMLASLESRAPFLDESVTRFAMNLPDGCKLARTRFKPLLKRVAARHLPRKVVHRRKRGLSVPVNQLMRTELRFEFERHVRDERFEQLDLLPRGHVGELVSQHEARRADHGRALWTLLVLGMWLEHWMGA